MQLNLSHVSYAYPGASLAAIDDATVTFPQGWSGVIGDNGCGKTTLAKIAAQELTPDSGTVSPKLFCAYCAQDSAFAPESLYDFAADWSRDARNLRSILDIEEDWLYEYDTLSGGQRKRVQIACALSSAPDVLVVDEPTNDLDERTRRAVAEALASFNGIGILVSHDRTLLDRLVSQCLIFEEGQPVMRPGNYTAAEHVAGIERMTARRVRIDAKREVERLQRESNRRKNEAAKANSRRSGKKLAKGDSDGRERIGRAIVSGKDGVAAKQSATMERRLVRAQDKLSKVVASKRYDGRLGDYGAISRSRCVVHVEAAVIHAGDFELTVPELWVSPDDHIAIVGDNGSGKSVLVRHLLNHIPDTVRFAYLPQDINAVRRDAALKLLRTLDKTLIGKVLSIVGRLNSAPERVLDGDDISPGELRKLLLAEQLLEEPELLVLDEPTNHLDMGSIKALQDMLASFPGAIVLVTHDATLRDAVGNQRWKTKRVGDTSMLTAIQESL